MTERLELGIIGLGKMGSSLSLQCLDRGINVVGHSAHGHPALDKAGVHIAPDYGSFSRLLKPPRLIYLSLPAGSTVDEVLGELVPYLSRGDVILDGGNSFYQDSIKREKTMAEKGFYFLDCGTSGGVEGARNGACLMVGGPKEGFDMAEPVLKKLCVEGGLLYTGEPGTGHFVKLVHNGIEFGMNHAIGDGVELLRHGGFDLDLQAIFENWAHGSVIRGWLVELFSKGLKENDFDSIPPYIEDTGEVNWLVQTAIDKEIAIPTIMIAIQLLFMSRGSGEDCGKAVALLRHKYGGHPLGKDERIAKERKTSRLTKI